jgi:hypothetical protein
MTPIREEFWELYERIRRSCFFPCKTTGQPVYHSITFIRKLKYFINEHKHADEFTMILAGEMFRHQWFKQWGK